MSARYLLHSRQIQTKYFKLLVVAALSNDRHTKGSSTQKLVNTLITWDIIHICLWCDIAARYHYIEVMIQSVASNHRPDLIQSVERDVTPNTQILHLMYMYMNKIRHFLLRHRNTRKLSEHLLNFSNKDIILRKNWRGVHIVQAYTLDTYIFIKYKVPPQMTPPPRIFRIGKWPPGEKFV